MNYISVCSGIEAASVAWHPLGWNCLGVSEIEPFPSAVLAHHYPSVPNFGDMTKFKEWKINGTVDLLVGGTPCQSFSVAGLRQGLKDPRGNLMLTYLAIAEHLRPRYIVWENVPGVLSSNSGKDFGSFLGGLGELGYGWAYRVLDAQWCRTHRHSRAVPQRRRRVFVVGCLGNPTSAAKVLFERESLSRYSAPRRATRQGTAADVEASVTTCWWDGENTASTLTKSNANGAQRMPDKDNFGAVLQPVAIPIMPQAMQAEGWRVGKESQDGRGNGLGVGKDGDPCPTLDRSAVPAVAIQGTVIGRQDHNGPSGSGCSDRGEMFTLNSTDVHAIAYSFDSLGSNSMKSSNPVSGCNVVDVAKCIDTSIPCPSKNQGGIAVAMVNMQGSKSNACVTDDGSSYTINAMHGHDIHAVAFAQNQIGEVRTGEIANTINTNSNASGRNTPMIAIKAPTLTATNDPSRSPQSSEITQQVAAVHASTMQVRRLTPTECERLQGFPDGWTAIPWKKKPADQCPDGPRYKALGNSMAVNCMEWLGERIQAVESGTL